MVFTAPCETIPLDIYILTNRVISLLSGEEKDEKSIAQTGAYGYSIHPLFAVSDKFNAYREFEDVFLL